MKVYIVYWSSVNERCEFTRIFTNEETAEKRCNHINNQKGLYAYYLEETVKEDFDWIDEEYFKWRANMK